MKSRLRDVVYVLVAVGVVAIVLLLVYLLVAIRQTQQSGSPAVKASTEASRDAEQASKDTKSLLLQFKDCVDPAGKCFKQGQRRGTETIAGLNQISILAAGCAVGFAALDVDDRIIKTQQCVIQKLAEQGGTP